MDVDRSFIERTDFSHEEHGYKPSEVEDHLRAVADAIAEMISLEAAGSVSLAAAAKVRRITDSASAQVQTIIETAEQTAAEVRQQGEVDAERAREEARLEARQLVEQAEREAAEVAERTAAQLREQSQADADRVREEARLEARQIVDRAEAQAAELAERRATELREQSEAEARRVRDEAKLQARQIVERAAEVAERSAAELREQSEADAVRVREEASLEATQIVEQAEAQAADVRESLVAARQLVERLGSGVMHLAVELDAVAKSLPASTAPNRADDGSQGGKARQPGGLPGEQDAEDGPAAPPRADSPVGPVREAREEESAPSARSEPSGVVTGSEASPSEVASREATEAVGPSSAEGPGGEGEHADPAPRSAVDDDEDVADRPTVWVSRPVDDDETGPTADEETTDRVDRDRDSDPGQDSVAAHDEGEPEQGQPAEQGPRHRSEKMRLLAFNMAVRGTKLKDVKAQLQQEFELTDSDREALDLIVEEAFDKAASWRLPLPHGRRRRFLSR